MVAAYRLDVPDFTHVGDDDAVRLVGARMPRAVPQGAQRLLARCSHGRTSVMISSSPMPPGISGVPACASAKPQLDQQVGRSTFVDGDGFVALIATLCSLTPASARYRGSAAHSARCCIGLGLSDRFRRGSTRCDSAAAGPPARWRPIVSDRNGRIESSSRAMMVEPS